MYLDFTWQSFSVQRRTDEHFGQLGRTTALDLDERILLDDVSHLLFLLLTFVDLFLEIGDLFRNSIETTSIGRTVRDGADKRGIRVFEWLQ